MSLYTINDVDLEIDMGDYDFQKKYEDAFEKMGEEEKALQKVGRSSEITKGYCQMFYNLFDRIFGDGTSVKLFGNKYNVSLTNDVYDQFISACKEQAKKLHGDMDKMASKYKPNRTQRRSK